MDLGGPTQNEPDSCGVCGHHSGQEFRAGPAGHALIRHDHVDGIARENVQSFGQVVGGEDPIAVATQDARERRAHVRLVVDEEDRIGAWLRRHLTVGQRVCTGALHPGSWRGVTDTAAKIRSRSARRRNFTNGTWMVGN